MASEKKPGGKKPDGEKPAGEMPTGEKPEATIDSLTSEARAHLLQAFRRILRPLVKILIRAGVRFDEFCETVKGVYIESAVRDGLGPLGKGTRARIAYVTGIARRDVDRYIDDPSLLAGPRPTFARILTEIIHIWHTDPMFQGPYGLPLELDFARSDDRSFSALAKRVDPKCDPVELVDELLRARVVVGSTDKFLKVLSRTYVVPVAMSAPMLEHLGLALTDLANTITHNADAEPAAKRIQRSVFPDRGLPSSMAPAFEKLIRSLVQQFITDVDNWVADNMKKYRPNRTDKRVDTGIAIYQYVRSDEVPPALYVLLPPGQ
ncbi:MAG: DUF6502 family protein [Steroidobacteraceae bacterium]